MRSEFQEESKGHSTRSKASQRTLQIGDEVKVETASGITRNYTLVHRKDHDPSKGRVGEHSPLGSALIGVGVNEEVEYLVDGDVKIALVLGIKKSAYYLP